MLGHNADRFAQGSQAVFPHVSAAEFHGTAGNVIEPGNQADQRGFAAAGAADDPDGLPGRGGEGNMLQARIAGGAVADGNVLKGKADRAVRHRGFAVFLRGLLKQDVVHAPGAGAGLGQRDDQVCQLDQFHQDLGHVVVQGDQLSLGQCAAVHLPGAGADEENDAGVQYKEGQGIQRGCQPPGEQLDPGQRLIQLREAFGLVLFLHKGADHPHAGQVFAGGAGDAVKVFPHLLLQGHRPQDDAEDDQEQDDDHGGEDQRTPGVNGECHDQRAENHKGGAQQQAQPEVDTRLHLVDIPGNPGNQRGGAEMIQISIGQGLDMGKEIMAQPGGKPDGGPCCKILGSHGGRKPEQRHRHQQQDASIHHRIGLKPEAFIHQLGDDQRNDQLKDRFQQLKCRPEDAFFPILLQPAPELSHSHISRLF